MPIQDAMVAGPDWKQQTSVPLENQTLFLCEIVLKQDKRNNTQMKFDITTCDKRHHRQTEHGIAASVFVKRSFNK